MLPTVGQNNRDHSFDFCQSDDRCSTFGEVCHNINPVMPPRFLICCSKAVIMSPLLRFAHEFCLGGLDTHMKISEHISMLSV